MASTESRTPKKRQAARQELFLNALKDCGGRISDAARSAGISRQTHHNWYQTSAHYRERFDAVAGSPNPKKEGRRGRPTKYGAGVVGAICSAVSEGMPFAHAAAIGGVSYQTFSEWRKEKPCFSDAIERAQAEGIQARLRLILSAAERGDVSSARWWLEHVVPEHFAKNRIDHQHRIEGDLRHSFAVPTEVLNAIAEARRRHDDN
jgi:hypothetical protein